MLADKISADLGILGGMGPQSTHYFTEELLSAIEARHHPQKDQDYPSIYVRYACHLPDRTSMLMSNRKHLLDVITREAQTLVEIGCPKILMPCISAHALLDSDLSQFPFIDIRKVVAAHIANSFPTATVGVLATRGARVSRAIDKLLPNAQQPQCLDEQDEEKLMVFIYREAKTWNGGKDISALKNFAGKLRQRGCDLIIAGCTEVEMCLARYAPEEHGFILPLRIAAQFYAATWKAT
jgi:aspartate racemase